MRRVLTRSLGLHCPREGCRRVPGLNDDSQEKDTDAMGVWSLQGAHSALCFPFGYLGKALGLAASYLNTCPVGTDTGGRGVELNKGAFSQPQGESIEACLPCFLGAARHAGVGTWAAGGNTESWARQT